MISDILRDQYNNGYNDGYDNGYTDGYNDGRSAGITTAMQDQLRTQVDLTVDRYRSDDFLSLEDAFRDPDYLFVVDTDISVLAADGSTCYLSGGDVLKVARTPGHNDVVAEMQVVTSKGESCFAGTVVTLSLEDLQEMLNSFSERVDDGLQKVQTLRRDLP